MNDDILTEPLLLCAEDEADMCWMVEEPSYRELSSLLEELPRLKGSSFVRQLKEIISHNEFKPLDDESDILIVGGENAEDYTNLLNAARKLLNVAWLKIRRSTEYSENYMKNKSHPKVTFKWSRGDKVLLPALSGVVKTYILTLQRYEIFQ